MRLVLASTSPRRRQILALLGVPFEVIAPEFEERISAHLPADQEVLGFALGKVDEEEAARTYKLLAEMDQLSELEIPQA